MRIIEFNYCDYFAPDFFTSSGNKKEYTCVLVEDNCNEFGTSEATITGN